MATDGILALWLNLNMTRMYPMSLGGRLLNKIPTNILVDASIYVPQLFQLAGGQLYVSSFLVRSDSVRLGIGMYCQKLYADLWVAGIARGIPVAVTDALLQDLHVIVLALTDALYEVAVSLPWVTDISGTVTVGHTMHLPWATTIQVYTPQLEATMLHIHCVHTAKAVVSALVVLGHRLTGDILVVAGDGVEIDVRGSAIYITAGSSAVSLLHAILQLRLMLGTPIVSINGIRPDADGNFTLVGMDCTVVQTRQGTISISNPCSKPCCGLSTASDLNTAVSILLLSKTILNDYYVSLSASINAMTSKLSLLINNLDK